MTEAEPSSGRRGGSHRDDHAAPAPGAERAQPRRDLRPVGRGRGRGGGPRRRGRDPTGADPAFAPASTLRRSPERHRPASAPGSRRGTGAQRARPVPVPSPRRQADHRRRQRRRGDGWTRGRAAVHFSRGSERAKFADTHARLGVMPGGGMTVLMAQTIGLRRAMELSLAGELLTAEEALRLGLVNHVVRTSSCCPSPATWPPTSSATTRSASAGCSSTIARSPTQRRSTRRTSSRASWPRAGSRGERRGGPTSRGRGPRPPADLVTR